MQIQELSGKLSRMFSPAERESSSADSPDENPLREELFSVDQLERHAKLVAAAHQLAKDRVRDKLLPRLDENQRVLLETYDLVASASQQNRPIEPAGEWLLDNFYLIEEQIREIRRLLPPSYSRELPRLARGPAAGFPRGYGISLELIAHVDGRVDAAGLNSFVASYQTVHTLKLGELWALPLMLRLALIENLRRVAVRIASARRDRDLADEWASRMVRVVEQQPSHLILVLADMARADVSLSGAFLSELTRQLQGQNPNFSLVNNWIDHHLVHQGLTIEQLVRSEGQSQAADQVSIGNSIHSLRFLNSHDWRQFVGEQSLVEQTLAEDPAGVYAGMDFASRNRYRHAVEGIARRSPLSEYEVARLVVRLAAERADENPAQRAAHVGYYLIDRGRPELEREAKMWLSGGVLLDKLRRRLPLTCYLATLLLVMVGATGLYLLCLQEYRVPEPALWLLAGLGLFCASRLGQGIANWIATQLLRPQSLARMNFDRGIPSEHRTLVAVPSMLTNPAGIDHLLEGLEVRYLANRDPSLHFALLTDFIDAANQTLPRDAELVRLAREGIERLNGKYAHVRTDIFFLFHRARRWNAQEKVWMGHERKRGKLADLNAMLRGATGRFAEVVGQTAVLPGVRYVITLDTDTQLPRDSAREMIGALAHPLNRPTYDASKSKVVDGYTILQPRVEVSLPSAQRSRFAQLFAEDTGIDPYTRVVSDVYQDLFGEGSFIGKGIYDVDSFEARCNDFPENAILSHDLIEGTFCRSGLLSDVTLYEEHPSRYEGDVARRHRWMRGDWQIAGWILPWVRERTGKRVRNSISTLSRWKILDNLRRSLVPVTMLLLLLVSWFVSPAAAVATLVFLAAVVLLPTLLSTAADLFRKPVELPLDMHLRETFVPLGRPLMQHLLLFVFLPYEAYISLDAIVRTLFRMGWSKRRLLEWKTSSDTERRADESLGHTLRAMAFAPLLASGVLCAIVLTRPEIFPIAGPLLAAWLAAPFIAWWLSQPIRKSVPRLSENQHHFLEKLSRKTWRYFEVFVTAEEHWLPPDNIQVNPDLVIASRTSPTNIGMALMADLSAYDFGYCSAAHLLERTQRTFTSLARMERYRGHFFNWYDTRTLEPLHPHYVSMVDSGNLVGNLLVLGSGYEELCEARILPPRMVGGLRDTLRVLLDVAHHSESSAGDAAMSRSVERQIAALNQAPATLSAARDLLSQLRTAAAALSAAALTASARNDAELAWWTNAYEYACLDHQADLLHLAPWLDLPAPPEEWGKTGFGAQHAAQGQLHAAFEHLERGATLREVAEVSRTILPLLETVLRESPPKVQGWLAQLKAALTLASERASARIQQFKVVAAECRELAAMDFELLYNAPRDLFSIGYNVSERRMDTSFYDLLASEARLASYIAIAQGNFGQEHWFTLGRLLTNSGRMPALLSWSGSMFEYLMPLLVMPNYENTLLDRTYQASVLRQIEYGRQQGVPWGISESGYNTIDSHRTYQYRAFGVPGLGLKRGLVEDLVIAPYASALALMVAPVAACRNLERLANDGREGAYGFFEAIDYTPSRLPPGRDSVTVRQFMAHHQGMSLLSLAYLLLDKPMQRRFLADPMLRAAELLLQERVPKATAPVIPHFSEARATQVASAEATGTMRVFTNPNSSTVEAHLLSNGQYHVAVTSSGGGYSRWRDLSVTRWREDSTRDSYGTFCYIRDLETGSLWSNSWQPTTTPTRKYEAIFSQARAEFRRVDDEIETYTQISVSPEDDIELRRVTLTNLSEKTRTIEVTSYAEVVLATQAQDESHPAFSNLFVQTELIRSHQAIYATRRPRSVEEQPPWLTHMMAVRGSTVGETSYETDRMQFIGRQQTLAHPAACTGTAPLSKCRAGSGPDCQYPPDNPPAAQ